jgi:uncharacterized protein YqgC (DUF456 family)
VTTAGLFLIGLLIAGGLIGVLVPALPGSLLVVAAILVWASEDARAVSWVVFALAAAVVAVAQVAKYALPHRRMTGAGVPRASVFGGALLGILGFFVVPVVGLFLGFVAGVYAAERRRLGSASSAWTSTRSALRAIGLSVFIEFCGALIAAALWMFGVLFTG